MDLVLFTSLLELLNLNSNVKEGHIEFGETFGAVLHHICNSETKNPSQNVNF